jgi:hypothetical protein
MGLQATVIQAIQTARVALGDLTILIILTKRVQNAYTPGTSVTYTTTDYEFSGVVTNYNSREIDGERITAQDLKVILFNELSAVPEPNDLITFSNQSYRVVTFQPIYAGSEKVLSVIQVRPSSA